MTCRPPVAIVGIGGLFPDSPDLETFWKHVRDGVDTSREVPEGRWVLPAEQAFDPEKGAPDKVYSTRACFLEDIELDLRGLAIDPDVAARLDPMVQITLHAGAAAWRDARTEGLDRSRVGVILGNIALPTESTSKMADWILGRGYANELFSGQRALQPEHCVQPQANLNRYVTGLPAGVLARALGLGAGHFTLDAACASSLFALKHAVDELQAGRADAMLSGGLSRPDCLYTQMGFAQLLALSPSGHCSPFDQKGDGLVVGEGAGIVVLKRLDDAVAAGDEIHAVIRGIGLSNDVDGNLLAPSVEGQLRAMRAAYHHAGWQPSSVDLIECHATGTPVGDAVELESLRELWGDSAFDVGQCTIGSVKSNVGHLLTGAGAAGLVKVLLAMREGVLPPTANFETAGDGIELSESPFQVRKTAADWPQRDGNPRRAAVSGFGFGGTNAHVLLEEWNPEAVSPAAVPSPDGDSIVIVGMAARCGDLDDLQAVQHRMLGGAVEHPISEKQNFFGQADPPKGWFLEDIEVRSGRFRIPPTEIAETLPQQLLMLDVADQALRDAEVDSLDRLQIGVFIGISLDLNTTNYHLRWALRARAAEYARALGMESDGADFDSWVDALCDGLGAPLNANRVMGNLGGIVASRVAREFGLGGPSYVLSSEESSGLTALSAAVRGLALGDLSAALVGAVDLPSDVRAVIATDGDRSYERDGRVRPFDRAAAGTLPGDGAACVILKRRCDAERDGDRIYATVCGIGSATGGEATALVPDQISYRRALLEAYAEAGISPANVDYLAAHGSGDSAEDQLEAKVLASFFGTAVLGSAVADVGHTGAASGLISVVKAVLGLHHRVLPPLRGLRNRRSGLGDLLTPEQPQYWLRDEGRVRCAGVSSMSVTGACYHVVLQEEALPARPSEVDPQPLGPRSEQLLIVEGPDIQALRAGLEELAKRAAETDIHALASLWWQEHGQDPDAALALAIVCRDSVHLQRLCAAAIPALGQADSNLLETSGRRVFFSSEPLGRSGEVAFVYPGSGSQYHGMGRELAVQWPGLLRSQEAACTRLREQLVPELIWNGEAAALDCEPRRLILAQVALGTLATDLVRSLGVQPAAVIGYSLGETAGLFSLGAWRERDEMLRRVMVSDLFTEQLTGPCLAARKTWALPEDEPVDWVLGVVDRSSEHVDAALASLPRAYRLIINTPDECVIGGQRGQVEAAVQAMQASFHQLHAVTTVHCEVAQAVKQAYYDLHILPTDEDVPVRFYSGEAGCSYQLSQTGAAASVANQALFGVDYPKVVRQAFDDGVRIFLEMGPGSSCTRMIRKILADESVAVRSVCANGQDGVSAILRTLAMLVAERAQVDLSSLYEDPVVPDPPGPSVRVRVGSPKLCPPALTGAVVQTTQAPVRVETPGRSQPIPVGGPVEASIAPDASWSAQSSDSVRGLAAANAEAVAAHDSYLRVAQQTTALLSQQIQTQFELIEQLQGGAGSGAVPSLSTVSFEAVPDRVSAAPPPLFDRDMCMEIATGSIAKVLGPDFEAVDTHPTRVRLPDEPLMLVDRILSIEGEARSMTHGKIVTEHDVLPGKWYLDNGRIPTCIAVEAGQADLFLSGYLGIDFETRGLAVYRLLDAVVTFHDQLPGVGKTIHYEIQIKEFFRQGDTWLFRFEFEATVDGCPLITMKEGCAGFFTQGELDAGQGIVESRMEQQARGAMAPGEVVPFAPMELQSLDEIQIAALRSGDLGAAFGPAFAGLPIANPLTLPTGNMELVHRVREINPSGGRYGIGSITAEADIHPDDWFLTCHFSDDMVMPGTLMYECCLHTLRIYLLRMGWVADAAEVVYQPVLGVRSRLKCRGQVLPGTRRVTYEVSIKQLGYGPEPFAVVDSLMYADDKPIVEINDMSVRLTGATREYLERVWREQVDEPASVEAPTILYDSESILAFSSGKPSQAFGAPYEIFDSGRKIARLPRPPFQFLDRITGVQGVAFEMKAGASCRAEVDITPDQWYFESNRQEQIPFAILLEMALQPCGWLAAYVGSALTSDEDLKFRNLGGESTQHTAVLPTTDTLVTEVEMTGVSSSAGMIIQHYRYRMTRRAGELVYDGTTYFGFFSHQALADQVGIRDAELHEPDDGELSRAETFEVPRVAPFADETMRMVDYIDIYVPDGGPDGLGFVRGTIDVDPSMWFFDAHFYQDPVWPGSLGLEAFLQVLKVIASRRWQLDDSARFATMPAGHSHSWSYRGQVVPSDNQVTIQACVKAVDDDLRTLVAEGFLSVDGRVIYQMQDFPLQVLP